MQDVRLSENVDLQRILIVSIPSTSIVAKHQLCGCEWQAAIVDPYSLGRLNVPMTIFPSPSVDQGPI